MNVQTASVENLKGKQIGNYRVVQRISQGGVGTVYKVRTAKYKFPLAMKILNPELFGDKKASGDLGKEYDICSKLRHKGLLKYFDFNTDEMRPYLIMEFFESQPFSRIIKNKTECKRFQAIGADILLHMAEAVAYLHLQGVIHRDIKPDNFLVNLEKRKVRLIDFSTAIKAHRGLFSLLNLGARQITGTPSYMSPEHIEKQKPVPSMDIYSFGAMIFELFTGRPPFIGKTQNEVLNRILKTPAPPLSRFNPDVSPELEKLVKHMLAKSPEQRPHSMEHFINTFSRIDIFHQ